MRLTRAAIVTIGAVAFAAALAGCSTSETCVDWVHYDTTAAMAKESRLIVTGRITGEVASTTLYGARAPIYRVKVDRVIKGVHDGKTLEVISTPETCGDTVTDQMKVSGKRTFELFLFKDNERWRTITAYQGVLPVGNKELPYHPVGGADSGTGTGLGSDIGSGDQ
jgi:hypothetical protein